MPLNPEAVGSVGEAHEASWTSKDALLYAVGIGAGTDELPYTTENTNGVDQQVFPTFTVVVGWGRGSALRNIGTFNPAMLVHGQQAITLHKPLPVNGSVTMQGRVDRDVRQGQGGGDRHRDRRNRSGRRPADVHQPLVARSSAARVDGEAIEAPAGRRTCHRSAPRITR